LPELSTIPEIDSPDLELRGGEMEDCVSNDMTLLAEKPQNTLPHLVEYTLSSLLENDRTFLSFDQCHQIALDNVSKWLSGASSVESEPEMKFIYLPSMAEAYEAKINDTLMLQECFNE
jgi:hypothetical protein